MNIVFDPEILHVNDVSNWDLGFIWIGVPQISFKIVTLNCSSCYSITSHWLSCVKTSIQLVMFQSSIWKDIKTQITECIFDFESDIFSHLLFFPSNGLYSSLSIMLWICHTHAMNLSKLNAKALNSRNISWISTLELNFNIVYICIFWG